MSQGLNKASDDGEIFEGFCWYFVVQGKTCKPYSEVNFNVFARFFYAGWFQNGCLWSAARNAGAYSRERNADWTCYETRGAFHSIPDSTKNSANSRSEWNRHFPEFHSQSLGVQYDTIRYDTIRYDTIRYDTIRYDTIRYNTLLTTPHGGFSLTMQLREVTN